MIDAILFDMDGTLYDESYPKAIAEFMTANYISEKAHIKASAIYNTFRATKKRISHSIADAYYKNNRKIWYDEVLSEHNITQIKGEEACEYYWRVMIDHIFPYEDLKYVLPWLKSNFSIYILTDENMEISTRKMKALGLYEDFHQIISSEQVGETKPSTKLFEFALMNISRSREDVMIIGDNPAADIKGGNLAGILTVWLRRGKYYYYLQKDQEVPNITIDNFIQLPNVLNNQLIGGVQ